MQNNFSIEFPAWLKPGNDKYRRRTLASDGEIR